MTYRGNGDGTFTLASTTPAPSGSDYMVLVDFNHDGKLDFTTAGNEIAYGNGNGTFQTPQPIVSSPPQAGFANIAMGDINNDGWPDLVLPITVFLKPTSTFFSTTRLGDLRRFRRHSAPSRPM